MARKRRTSGAEDIVAIASMLPWWAALLLAVVTYLGLHAYVAQPVALSPVPGQVANAIIPMVMKGLASVLQYVLPLLFAIAAVISWLKGKKAAATSSSPSNAKPQTSPSASKPAISCPVCSSSMVLRTSKKGSNAGTSFWGCSNYPRCKGTRVAN